MVLRSRTNSIPVKSKNLPLTHKSIAETTRKKESYRVLYLKILLFFSLPVFFFLELRPDLWWVDLPVERF